MTIGGQEAFKFFHAVVVTRSNAVGFRLIPLSDNQTRIWRFDTDSGCFLQTTGPPSNLSIRLLDQPRPRNEPGIINGSVAKVDLDIDGVNEADEESIGALLALQGNRSLLFLSLRSNLNTGSVCLQASAGAEKIRIWDAATNGNEVTLPRIWQLDSDPLPEELYVEGIAASGSARDISLEWIHTRPDGSQISDTLKLTVADTRTFRLMLARDDGFDLDIDGVPPEERESIGGFIALNGSERLPILLEIPSSLLDLGGGSVTLSATSGNDKIQVWTKAVEGENLTLPKTWDLDQDSVPAKLYIAARNLSTRARDITLTLGYRPDNGAAAQILERTIKLTVLQIDITRLGTWANAILTIHRPSPNNTRRFQARIRPADLQAPIHFRLTDVSKEQGVNMNSGIDRGFDLSFENQDGFMEPAAPKQSIRETEANGRDNMATVSLTAHDYGAYGRIHAFIDFGRDRRLESADLPVIEDELPADGNRIEDAWDRAFPDPNVDNLANMVDADDDPAGDGTNGDFLTRYEEYRGFTIKGRYTTTDPGKKDVFVVDLTGHVISDGNGDIFSLFRKLGPTVHVLNRNETNGKPDRRILANDRNEQRRRKRLGWSINFNDSKTNQRAIVLENAHLLNHPDLKEPGWPWGLTGGVYQETSNAYITLRKKITSPSNYRYCRIDIKKHQAMLNLFFAIDADDDTLIYDGRKDTNPLTPWQRNGRVKIGNEIIGAIGKELLQGRT